MFPQWNIPQQWESTIYSYVPQQEWILDKRCKLKRLDMDWKLCCSKIHILKPQPQCDDIWEVKSGYMRSWGWSSMIKGRDWNLCFLSLSLSLCHVRTQQKGSHVRARKTALTGTWPCRHPDFKLPASRNGRKYISIVQATKAMACGNGSPSWPRQKEYSGRKTVSSIQTKVTR